MGSMERPTTPAGLTPAHPDPDDDGRRCPWCGSRATERIGEWGPQLLTEQYICLTCRSPFERIRR
jgi:DNA-directed RNA polymerase subunit RPC12/RpoP